MRQQSPRQKLFQPDNDGPDERLVVESYAESENASVYHQERKDGEWEDIGLLEITPAYHLSKGTFDEDGPLLEWGYTRFHASGDRVKVDHRITTVSDADGINLTHQNRRRQVLGPDRRETHDWRTIEEWRVTRHGFTKVADIGAEDGDSP